MFIINLIVYFWIFYLPFVCGIGLYFDSSQALNYDLLDRLDINYHSRGRRSLSSNSSQSCMDVLDEAAEKKVLKFPYPLKDDRNMDLQLVFLGKKFETEVLLTTMRQYFVSIFTRDKKSSNLYQSTDGGRTFQRVLHKIGTSSIRSTYGIFRSSLDPDWIILISYTSASNSFFGSFFSSFNQKSVLLVSKNAGKNFTSINLEFKLRENEPLIFHPKKKGWIIGLEERKTEIKLGGVEKQYGQAWISKDFGKTWKVMMKGHVASSVKWGAAEGKEGDELYLSTHTKSTSGFSSFFSLFRSSSTLTLWKSSDGGTFFEEIIEHCYNFGVEGDFVFASVTLKDGNSDEKRILHVSRDSGTTFRPVNVPEIGSDRFYSVLEMHKGMIFLHVDAVKNTGKGTLYISGADGLMYTKSLADHFYTNNGFTDFSRIESMHGVYITQVLQKDNTLQSVITFDRGVSWQSLYVDKKKYCKNIDDVCTLHFHKEYSRVKRHVDVQAPLSSENAPGIIFMHGQAGDALTGSAQVWLSTNGGYNWTKVADTPHHYAIGDNGNLLVIVPRINNTGNILLYSIDQGRCWHKYKFSDENQEIVVRGLVTEPHAQQRTFSLWGYFKDASVSDREWNVITVGFNGMFKKQCDTEDFEEWSPHILNKKSGCFLGEKLTYQRPKLDANCYLGKDFSALLKTEKCNCDKDDLECDYGYERQNDGSCKENKSIKPIEVCKKGEKMEEKFSKGYRRVPGDACESKSAIDDKVRMIDEHVKCTASKEDIFGIIDMEKAYAAKHKKNEKETDEGDGDKEGNYDTKIKPMRSKGHGFLILVGVLLVLGVLVGGAWFGVKKMRQNRAQATSFSALTDDLGEDNDILYNPKPKTERHYKDESDDDDDVLLTV